MDYNDFMVDRAQHMRPLEYDLSENHNVLVRYLHDMGVLDNVLVGTLGPAEILKASDALAAPLRSLVVGGNSVQDGTPTPDTPVPIQSVDNLALHANGTQGVMRWNQLNNNNRLPQTTSGVTITAGANGAAIVTGQATLDNSIPIQNVALAAGHKYLIKGCPAGGGASTYDLNVSGFGLDYGAGSMFTSPSDYTNTYLRLHVRLNVVFDNVTFYPQLFDLTAMFGAGNEPTTVAEFEALFPEPYYPYDAGSWIDAPNWPVQLTLEQPLRSLPNDIKDTLSLTYLRPSSREGWSWYSGEVTRRVRIEIINGSETGWIKSISHEGGYYLPNWALNRGVANTVNHIQNRFVTATNFNDYIVGSCLFENALNLRVDNNLYPSVAAFKAWLADNPTTILYPLATPTTETLPEIELPSIVGPTCTIYATADVTPPLTAQYIRNLSVSMSDMQTAIADIISG